MKAPRGFVGHVRDIAKGNCVRDPDVRFTGKLASTRVFLRTDGLYAVTVDRGESFGALRYEPRQVLKTLEYATEAARRLAGPPCT